ncbi:MAG: response regulator [Desulfovibrionales bacterium]
MAFERTKILIVEDDRFAREYIQEWLRGRGYDVVLAADGLQALEVFKKQQPDLLLLDLNIPKLDGLQVLERIRAGSPDVPVIIVSGRSDISAAIEAFTRGAWDYITKPIVSLDYLERTIRNCLERKILQQEVAQAEKRYYDLIQNLPLIIFIIRRDFQLEFINETIESTLGYSPEEVLNTPDWFVDHVYADDRTAVRNALSRSFESGTPFSVEFRFEHKKGYLVNLHAKSISLDKAENGNSHDQLEGIITDVTEHNFLDTVLVQKEKLNTLGALSAELAHEIRNPLVPLAGFAKRLHKKHPDLPETGIILKEAARLEDLLDRISEYLKPVEVQRQEVQLHPIITFCLDMLGAKLDKQEVTSTVEPKGHVASVFSDPDILKQVFINLISSGLESVSRGGKIRVKIHETKQLTSVELRVGPLSTRVQNPEVLLLPLEKDVRNYSVAVSYRMIKDVGGYLSFGQDGKYATYTLTLPKKEIPETLALSLPT